MRLESNDNANEIMRCSILNLKHCQLQTKATLFHSYITGMASFTYTYGIYIDIVMCIPRLVWASRLTCWETDERRGSRTNPATEIPQSWREKEREAAFTRHPRIGTTSSISLPLHSRNEQETTQLSRLSILTPDALSSTNHPHSLGELLESTQ